MKNTSVSLENYKSIASKNMGADPDEVKSIFKPCCNDDNVE